MNLVHAHPNETESLALSLEGTVSRFETMVIVALKRCWSTLEVVHFCQGLGS